LQLLFTLDATATATIHTIRFNMPHLLLSQSLGYI